MNFTMLGKSVLVQQLVSSKSSVGYQLVISAGLLVAVFEAEALSVCE